ncbi:hypothetical protein [Kribbella sp. NPDC023855]|uniref:hypothetical protein n=1 Tax=Kribbella sp. NPDC023855 TaxID=3154698 RepID=UPI003407F07D
MAKRPPNQPSLPEHASDAWRRYRIEYTNQVDREAESRRIITGVQVCSRLLMLGSGLTLATIVGKLLADGSTLSIGVVEVPLGYAWAAFVALTGAHVFNAVFLTKRIFGYLPHLPTGEHASQMFRDITTTSNPFLFGLRPRALPRRPGGIYHPMSRSDPSAWVAYGAALLLLIALLPWSLDSGRLRWADGFDLWTQVALAVLLILVNWWAGSIWIVAFSRLHHLGNELRDLKDGPLRPDDIKQLVEPFGPDWDIWSLSDPAAYRLANLFLRYAEFPLAESKREQCVLPHRNQRPEYWGRGLCRFHSQQIALAYKALRKAYPDLALPDHTVFVARDVPPVPSPGRGERFLEWLDDRSYHREFKPSRRRRNRTRNRWWEFVS